MSVCPCGKPTRRTARSVAIERSDHSGAPLPSVVYCASCSSRIWRAVDDYEDHKKTIRALATERGNALKSGRDWPPSSETRIMRVQVRDPALVLEADTFSVEA